MISSLVEMTERKPRPKGPVSNIDESDRLAILARMAEKSVGKAQLAAACGVTKSAITLLLTKPIPKGKTRGCKFLAKIQTTLDLAVTARRPTVVPGEHQRRVDQIVKTLLDDPEALEQWLSQGEWNAKKMRG